MKMLLALLLAPLAALAHPAGLPPTPPPHLMPRQSPASVDQLIKAKGKLYFGVAIDNGTLQEGKNAAIIQKNFGQVTHEWSMKWDAIQPAPGTFTFDTADVLFNWALRNNKTIRGHTLLWHRQLPAWVEAIKDKVTLAKVIDTHVKTVVGRYKGRIMAWDVVNEVFNDNGTLRDSHFHQVLGEAYIGIAFRAARAADPSAKLYINEYNLDNAGWGKGIALVAKVNQWIGLGLPIDGIGSQAHIHPGMAVNIQAALQQLAASRVSEIAITELDITTAPPNDYATVVGACLSVPKCRGITVWGVSDKNSWMSDQKPLLFDENYNPKPAYDAIVSRLRQ